MKLILIIAFCLFSSSILNSKLSWIGLKLNVSIQVNSIVTNDDDAIFCVLDSGRIYRYLWGNDNWELINKVEGLRKDHTQIAIDNKGYLYADAFEDTPSRSTDMGDSWHLYNTGIIPKWEYDTSAYVLGSNLRGDVFVLQTRTNDIYQLSAENGNSWQNISNFKNSKSEIEAICFDTFGNLFIAYSVQDSNSEYFGYIYKYDLTTKEFKKIKDDLPAICYMRQISADDNGNIYIIRNRLFESDRNILEMSKKESESWEILKSINMTYGMLMPTLNHVLIYTNENVLYMPSQTGLNKFSLDDYSFEPVNDGLPDSCTITCMHLSKNGYLYLGTAEGEIYYSSEPVTGINDEINYRSTFNIFPNPVTVSEGFKINFSLENNNNIKIDIVNALGIKVADNFSGRKETGNNIIPFKFKESQSSGMYWVRIIINGSEQVVKPLIIQ